MNSFEFECIYTRKKQEVCDTLAFRKHDVILLLLLAPFFHYNFNKNKNALKFNLKKLCALPSTIVSTRCENGKMVAQSIGKMYPIPIYRRRSGRSKKKPYSDEMRFVACCCSFLYTYIRFFIYFELFILSFCFILKDLIIVVIFAVAGC